MRERLQSLLEAGVRDGVFPGAVAACAWWDATAFMAIGAAAGELEPGGSGVTLDTVYDLASLTKPFVALSALRLAQLGRVSLEVPVARYLPELSDTLGGQATLEALLSHRAGLSPWGGLFREIPGALGSAEARRFMLREAASRPDPSAKASGSVYSDLGYLVAGEAVSRAAGMSLDAIVREQVTVPLCIADSVFYAAALPQRARTELEAKVAPTEACDFRGRLVRGEVHDENCAAFGGIAGHAGLFGDARSVLHLGLGVLDVLHGRSSWLHRDRLTWALRPREGGGHVVGWDTKSEVGSSAGTRLSSSSFGHLGFTGTSIWCDPERQLCVVLLSNRVHPSRENILIRTLRPAFHDAVVDAIEG